MDIQKTGIAGTMESSDIMVTVAPPTGDTIKIDLTSSVEKQFGRQIKKTITECTNRLGVTKADITAVDKGALDCVIRARVETAVYRACGSTAYRWETK
jgi:citrate lyase subunit gamma (acyl carrier protein)